MPADGCCTAADALSLADVEALLRESLAAVPAETLALETATARVLAEPVTASGQMPPFASAAMDGFALRRDDLEGPGPWRLPVSLRTVAGDAAGILPSGHCARIFTGAPVPTGADCVVMQEHVLGDGSHAVFRSCPETGSHIRRAGQDRRAGELVLPAGRRLDARSMLAAAAAGAATVRVRRELRVATVTTGAELRPAGCPLEPGRIWDANGPMLRAAFSDPAIALDHTMLPVDSSDEQARHLRLLTGHDLIVTTGGVSVGEGDRLREAILQAGGEARALRLAIKPGQHLLIGTIGHSFILGLPGNPVSAFVTCRLLGGFAVKLLLGLQEDEAICFARPSVPIRRKPGRREYRPARISGHGVDGLPIVELAPPDFSARAGWFGSADALAILPEDCSKLDENDEIVVVRL